MAHVSQANVSHDLVSCYVLIGQVGKCVIRKVAAGGVHHMVRAGDLHSGEMGPFEAASANRFR